MYNITQFPKDFIVLSWYSGRKKEREVINIEIVAEWRNQ
jgi:hypothetical protein